MLFPVAPRSRAIHATNVRTTARRLHSPRGVKPPARAKSPAALYIGVLHIDQTGRPTFVRWEETRDIDPFHVKLRPKAGSAAASASASVA